MDPIFQAVRYVATPLTLVAFVVATIAYVLRARLSEKHKIVEAAAPESRVEVIDRLFRDFGQVPTADLTREQRYRLALRLIGERQTRFRGLLSTSLIASAILASLVVIVSLIPGGQTTLTVHAHGAQGQAYVVNRGKITVSQDAHSTTLEVSAAGTPLAFPLISPPSTSHPVRILASADGFLSSSRTITAIAADGVIDIALEGDDTEREVRGTVKDLGTNRMLVGVTLDFDSGRAVATTDKLGDFSTRLRAHAGEKLSIVARRGDAVGFNGFVTVSDQPITLYFEAKKGHP